MPEERLIFPDLTVAENLSMGVWRGYGGRRRAFRARAGDVSAPAGPLPRQRGRTLSGGEQQMLAIGRALMAEPRLLLVDEPTEGLAPVIVQALERIFGDTGRSGSSVLVVESKLAVARRIADRITVMAKGRDRVPRHAGDLQSNGAVRRAISRSLAAAF